ncbi:MAG: hypothetical protein AAF531_24455 [Actinomycetota bacterium]
MIRLLKWRRLRWLVIGGVARFLARRTTARSVDQATADLEARLPAPVQKALKAAPADAVRLGGSAVVAGRTARRVAVNTHRATKATADGRRRLAAEVGRIRNLRTDIGREAENRRRELKAEYLRITRGNGAADDALMDVRTEPLPGFDGTEPGDANGSEDGGGFAENSGFAAAEDPPTVDPPVRPGRWRAERRLRPTSVGRVQRSYRPARRPWDR